MNYKEFMEAKIKKIVNRRGKIRKTKSAGKRGKKVDSKGGIVSQTAAEKKNRRMGLIKRKRTVKKISSSKKKRSRRFASMGRAKRKAQNVKDFRSR